MYGSRASSSTDAHTLRDWLARRVSASVLEASSSQRYSAAAAATTAGKIRGSSKGEGAAGLSKLADRQPYRHGAGHGAIDDWVSALIRIYSSHRRSKKKGFPNEASARRPSGT